MYGHGGRAASVHICHECDAGHKRNIKTDFGAIGHNPTMMCMGVRMVTHEGHM